MVDSELSKAPNKLHQHGKPHVDFLVLLPLEEELQEFVTHFPSVENVSTDLAWRHFVNPDGTGYSILAVQCTSAGRMSAINALMDAYSNYDISVVVCIGIAGGLSSDLRLGDVCYTGTVTDVLDNAKASDDDNDGINFAFVPTTFATDPRLSIAFNFVRTQPDIAGDYLEWQRRRLDIAVTQCGDFYQVEVALGKRWNYRERCAETLFVRLCQSQRSSTSACVI